MQSLRVSVAEILGQPGAYRDLKVQHPLPGVRTALARLSQGDPIRAELRAESVVEGILVTGKAAGQGHFRCARCLKPLDAEVEVEVCELYVTPGHEAPAEEEVYEVQGDEVDLEPMLRDALALSLPLNPVCRADCQGLCAGCGKDLNDGPCECVDDEIDPRWAPLSELRERLG